MSMPFDPATSIRTPRVTRPPTCSDPELLELRTRADFAELEAIVEALAPHLVREGVELRADLAELGDDELLVDLAGIRYRRGRLGVDVEDAAGVDEGLLGIRGQHGAELEHPPGAAPLLRAQGRFGASHVS